MDQKRKLLLRLLNLYCFLTDESGSDEIYLVVDNKRVWPEQGRFHSVRPGQTVINTQVGGFRPGQEIEIEIWDYDYISRNDLLGKVPVYLDEPGGPYITDMIQNEQETEKAKYSIEWEIDFE